MDAVRHGLALALLVAFPPALLFWLAVHPFVRFWRRLGPWWTYALVWTPIAAGMVLLWRARATLLAVDWGTRWPLVALGLACLAAAVWLRTRLHRHMSNATMAGLSELDPKGHPQPLVTEGPWAWVRHPRYAQLTLALLGWALVANHPATWVIFALSVPALGLTALLEERELRERFGAAWEEYCRGVPRFVPRRPRSR